MIRKLLAAAKSDNAGFALAAMCVVVGMKIVEKILTERADHLTALDAAIAERQAELAVLLAQPGYPAPVDLDPLGRAADEDELVVA